MKRRQFLKLMLASLAGAPLLACESSPAAPPTARPNPTPNPMPSDSANPSYPWDTLVIGAGMAGLRAAQMLSQAGQRVLVLEARNRLGGRTWTDDALGLPVDLGASWIHGIEGNPIHALAQRLNAQLAYTDYDDMTRYTAEGAPLSASADRALEALFERVLAQATAFAERQNRDLSLQAALDAVTASLTPAERRNLAYAVNTTIEHEFAASAVDLSAWYYDEAEAFDGDDVIFPQGYGQLVNALSAGLDIRLEHAVTQVAYEAAGVAVTTAQGVFRARAVIVTVPLGVLQSGAIQFLPALPPAKQQALNRLGMGVLNKCYLRFPAAFWEDSHLLGYVGERPGEWAEWLNLHALIGEPVLLGFNAGTFGRALEQASDRATVDSAMQVLRALYGINIPDPVAYRLTRWGRDPWAGGSYSFLKVGSTPDDYDTLAEPVAGRVFFAGEHTSRAYPGTVHGAYLSGERAAREALQAR